MCSGWVEAGRLAEWRISRLPNKMVISHFWEVTRGEEEEYQYQETLHLESKALQFRHRYSQYLEKMQTGNLNLLKVPILYTRDFHTLRIYQDTFIIFKHSTRNLDASPAKSKQRHTNAAVLSIFANQTSHWFFHSAPSHSCLTVSLVTAPLSLSAAEAVNWLVSAPVSAGLARCRGQPCRGVMNAMFISEMGLFLRNLIKYLNVFLCWSLNTSWSMNHESLRIYLCI